MAKTVTQRSYLPPNWDDNVRMNALFSDFRNRNVNPNDWDAKLNFWRQSVGKWCTVCNNITFTVRELRQAFNRHGRTPRGLTTVTAEMIRDGQVMTLAEFLKYTAEPGWISWSWDILVKRPLSYSWSFISKSLWPSQDNDNEELVLIELIKEKSAEILQRHHSLVESGDEDNTVTLTVLAAQCKDICKNVKDLELCLLFLRKQKALSLHVDQQQKIVKFFGDEPQRKPETLELSQTEKALLQLKRVKKDLEHQIELHESEAEKYKNEAKQHLKLGSRAQAKVALQKKKQAESHLTKKDQALENVEVLLHRLKDVDTQKAVIDALQIGTNAFKSDSFDVDKVDETMATVQETLEIQQELQDVISKPVGFEPNISELEKELEDILAGDAKGDNSTYVSDDVPIDDTPRFPEPPMESPGKASIIPETVPLQS